ncbi:MAG TPA: MFS transporter [Candidatus Sulfotelmatobacter sp.]|nr:MFS transporter [Candidatus Sulfotelmatobacter sp.]
MKPWALTRPVGWLRLPRLVRLFAPAPPAAVQVTDPAAVETAYRSWRRRVLFSTIIGYATFYLVRKNLGIAMPLLEKDLGISKADLGLFLTLHGVLYGVSKFANGFLGDRCNARAFMVAGLVASAFMNICFGFGSAVVTLGLCWMLNGWFQGMGFPPCGRLMAHWFSPKELATKMCLWNTSHSLGAGLAVVLCGYLAVINWRLCFLVPAILAGICALFLGACLPDTPPSVGLPEVAGTQFPAARSGSAIPARESPDAPPEDFRAFVVERVLRNPYIWLLALANFFVYTVRYAVLDWGPTLLTETKGLKLTQAGWMVAGFEISGALGMLLSGWLTDHIFGGRGARACLVFMILAGLAIFGFWQTPAASPRLSTLALCVAGFFIYGPQALIGITAANLATKRAAATAIGFTGLFAYASTVLSGWGLGVLVQRHGWDAGFCALIGASVAGVILLALVWRAKPHGYTDCP